MCLKSWTREKSSDEEASGNEKVNNLPDSLKFRGGGEETHTHTVSILKLLSEEHDKLNTCSDNGM